MNDNLSSKPTVIEVRINHTDENTFTTGWVALDNLNSESEKITVMHTVNTGEAPSTVFATDVDREAVIGEVTRL